jgi:WXG100 family type VII secretion target
MTGTIKVNTTKLISTANSFNSTGKQIKNITTQMTSTVNSLSGSVWSGDAANAYKKKFQQLQDDINRMINMINEHVTDLNKMADEYKNTDDKSINIANALSGDVIV